MLIDTHCHLTDEDLATRLDEVLARSAAAGLDRMVTVATSPQDWSAAQQLVDVHEAVYLAAGLHPHNAEMFSGAVLAELEAVLSGPKVVALGEIGLEYHYDFCPRAHQHEAFAAQLDLARRLDIPVVVHCRDAHADCLAILDEQQMRDRPVAYHCFSGGPEDAQRILDRGWYISMAGNVTYKNARDLQAAAKVVPADRLLVETDSPYLTPEPVRKVRPNEPSHVVHTARYLAGLRDQGFEEFVAACTKNSGRFFKMAGR